MPGQRWMILAVLFAARAATGFQFQSVGSTATMLMRDLAIDYSEIGMLLGAYLCPASLSRFRRECWASGFGTRRSASSACC